METNEGGLEVVQRQGAWVIRMWWPSGPITGGPQRVTVEAAEGAPAAELARGVSTTVLRRLDIPGAVKEAEKAAPALEEGARKAIEQMEEAGRVAGALLSTEGVSVRYVALLAATYVQMTAMGTPRPADALARLIERRPETVKDHLKKARRDGLLTTVTGKAGGELTGKAREVLRGMREEKE
ncbi:hypothetical protein ACIQKE_01735 [Streptomyces griseoviridis]